MIIGQAAARSGVLSKTIRCYEEIGLIAPAAKLVSAYPSSASDLGYPFPIP